MDLAIRLSLLTLINNYAEMSVLNVKSIKVTNGENKDNIPLQVSPKGGGAGA